MYNPQFSICTVKTYIDIYLMMIFKVESALIAYKVAIMPAVGSALNECIMAIYLYLYIIAE